MTQIEEVGKGRYDVYVLKLVDGKYYVGRAQDVEDRIDRHMSGNGSAWTKEYEPLEVLKIYKGVPKDFERTMTLECMRRFGWENVRGGRWTQVDMDYPPKEFRG